MTTPTGKTALRALIIDDEPLAREGIRLLLAGDSEITIVGEAVDGIDAVSSIRRLCPDLIFLDVQMPEKSGLDVLRELPSGSLPIVVFVTAFDKYAVDAFERHALDYLLKPVEAKRFAQTLGRVKERFRERKLTEITARLLDLMRDGSVLQVGPTAYTRRIAASLSGRIQLVDVDSIDWIEAADDYVRLHAGKSVHLVRNTLSALEHELDPQKFVRIHRSTIVNLARIREMRSEGQGDYEVLLNDGTRLRLSRTYRDRLAQYLA